MGKTILQRLKPIRCVRYTLAYIEVDIPAREGKAESTVWWYFEGKKNRPRIFVHLETGILGLSDILEISS